MTEARDTMMDRLGRYLAKRLMRTTSDHPPFTHPNIEALRQSLEPGDVLLVEGVTRVSGAIKYLTQSTWSHSALYVGDLLEETTPDGDALCLIEVNLGEGCIAVPLSKYEHLNTRICRANGLSAEDRNQVVGFMADALGARYDMKHIFDLLRYFVPTPPVPVRWRRRALAFGSGDPTRAICSSLIAQAFQGIRYPILPVITHEFRTDARARDQRREILHIRHHSLFAPRDFDLSPYFHVVKPTLAVGFDYQKLTWSDYAPER
jgi:hypothetical protein